MLLKRKEPSEYVALWRPLLVTWQKSCHEGGAPAAPGGRFWYCTLHQPLGTCYEALNKNREPAKAQNFVSALLKVLLGLLEVRLPGRTHS